MVFLGSIKDKSTYIYRLNLKQKKMNFLKLCLIISISTLSVFNMKSQDKLNQGLVTIKEKIKDVQIDKSTYKQSIEILDGNKGQINFTSTLVDEKGKSIKENYILYISDLDQNTVTRKISGKKLSVNMTVKGNQKYIKHFKDDKLDGYRGSLEILSSSADEAQELVDLFKSTIPLVKPGIKTWSTNTEAMNWLKNNITKVSSGTETYEQSFTVGDRKNYLAGFTVKKTDQKGMSTEGKYEFSLLDINKSGLEVRISGTELGVTVETNGNNHYIKYTKNGEQQNFDNSFQILAEDIDQARNIISAFSAAIEKSKQIIPDFSNAQKSFDFISKNITDQTIEKKDVKQKIGFVQGNGTKSTFTCTETDSKGKITEEKYEFYLNDIDENSVNFKVSGGKITLVLLSENNTKFIKYFKDNVQQDYQDELGLFSNDIETSRELVAAFKSAIKFSQTQPATWKSVNDATNYLTNTLKGEMAGTETYKLDFSAITPDPLNVRYVVSKTDVKGISTEQVCEFYPYMLDAGSVKITSAGKFLSISASVNNKKPFIKVFKGGIQQSYDDGLTLMAFDAKQARDIAEAVKFIFSTVKAKNKVWNDKISALKFITDNVSDIKGDKKDVKQKIEFRNDDPCNLSYSVSSTDENGKTTDGIYEFTLKDINVQTVEFNVSGKNVFINLSCKNKAKLIKVYKNSVQQAWSTSVELQCNDLESARNIAEAFKSAITFCEK